MVRSILNMGLKQFILKAKTSRFQQYLKSIDENRLRIDSEKKVLEVFRKAARDVPAYKDFLRNSNVSSGDIYDIYDFKRKVPVWDKQAAFGAFRGKVEKLCLPGYFSDIREIISSSGHSGNFSYGLSSRGAQKQLREMTDVMLDYTFGISDKKTLLINALPMGIKVRSDYLVVADTGPRADTVVSLLSEFGFKFEQVIIAADNNFAKNMLEDALDCGVDIKKMKIHLILGEEILAENMRGYLAHILGENLNASDSAFIGSSYGIAEFGLNIMFETRETIGLRRLMRKNAPYDAHPVIFHYFPTRTYIEEYKAENYTELVMTGLDENAILPLVRYNTHDCGKVIPRHSELSIGLPVVELSDRDKLVLPDGKVIRPQLIKEALFADFSVAPQVTRYFRLSQVNGRLNIDIQHKNGKEKNISLEEKINASLHSFLRAPFQVNICPYLSFPYGLHLDYERKFRYI